MKYDLPVILHLTYKYIWISAGPTLRAGGEGKVGEGRRGRGREGRIHHVLPNMEADRRLCFYCNKYYWPVNLHSSQVVSGTL